MSEFDQGAIASICCSCLPALCAYKCSHAVGLGPKSLGGIKQVPVLAVNQMILCLWIRVVHIKTYYDIDLWLYNIIYNALIHHIHEFFTPNYLGSEIIPSIIARLTTSTCVLSIGEQNLKRGVLHEFGHMREAPNERHRSHCH